MQVGPKIVLACDNMSVSQAIYFASHFKDRDGFWGVKLNSGADGESLRDLNHLKKYGNLWIDYKFIDIPETVKNRVTKWASIADIMTIMAMSGPKAMQASVEEVIRLNLDPRSLAAVTILTSMDEDDLRKIGMQVDELGIPGLVSKLASLANDCGIGSLVCSVKELDTVRGLMNMRKATPGIRLPTDSVDDQKRIGEPKEAVRLGADLLVIGRPIFNALDPVTAFEKIVANIREGLQD